MERRLPHLLIPAIAAITLVLSAPALGQALYDPSNVATIEFSVYDAVAGALVETGPQDWQNQVWVVAPIAAGDERVVVAVLRDADGNGLYWGELAGVTVPADGLFGGGGVLLMGVVPEGIMVIVPPFTFVGVMTLIPFQLEVALDVKPGSEENPVNLGSHGVVPAAVLGTPDFDVTSVDPDSLRLAGCAPVRITVSDVCTYVGDDGAEEISTDGPDGIPDLVFHVATEDLAEALAAYGDGDSAPVVLTGNLHDGTMIEGVDTLQVSRKNGGQGKGKQR